MEPTPINTRTARDYWKFVTKDDDATDNAKTDTPNDDLYEEDEWEDEDTSQLMPPYTMEEIEARLAQSEKDIAEGRCRDAFEAIAEFKANFARKKAMETELELAEAV